MAELATFRWCGYASAGRDQAAFVLFNNETTELRRRFNLKRLSFRPIAPTSGTGSGGSLTHGPWQFKRLSAISGGVDIPYVKADTGSSNIPSQVRIAMYADVTESGGLLFSRVLQPISCNNPVSAMALASRPGAHDVASGRFLDVGGPGTDIQPITLAEGQGLGLVAGDPLRLPFNAAWNLSAEIVVGSASYFVMAVVSPLPTGSASFAVLNGAGSGVSVAVRRIFLTNTSDPQSVAPLVSAPHARVIRVSNVTGGLNETPIMHDTQDHIPAAMVVRRGVAWSPIEVNELLPTDRLGLSVADLGYPGANDALVRQIGCTHRSLVGHRSLMSPDVAQGGFIFNEFHPSQVQHGFSYDGSISDIAVPRLGPQQGLALVSSDNHMFQTYYIECTWTHRSSTDAPMNHHLLVS